MIKYNFKTKTVIGPKGSAVLTERQDLILRSLPAYPAAIKMVDLIRQVWGERSTIHLCRASMVTLSGILQQVGYPPEAINHESHVGYSIRA